MRAVRDDRTHGSQIAFAMHIAFYAPLKPPTHGTPSGDRRVAALLMKALQRVGHDVELVSEFRSLDAQGDAQHQADLREQGMQLMQRLVSGWISGPAAARPDLWFTYHVYYKAPDWLGPGACAALRIPYVIAEASFAPKRAGGRWALGHEAAREAIARANLVLAPTRHDMECLRPLLAAPDRIAQLPPFLDAQPFHDALLDRAAHRARLAGVHRLDAALPWIVITAMMREGDKLASYRELAAALALLGDLPWQVVIAGDGPARAAVVAAVNRAAPGRARFLGELSGDKLAAAYAACDLFLWPAVNEAYGMAMLEAQAAGVPVVSCALRGVPDVVCDGQTGLLVPPQDPQALAAAARALLLDPERRRAMGERAQAWVAGERSLETAAARLDEALVRVAARTGTH